MTRRLLLATATAAAALFAVVGIARPASAGGWAITTLDSLPPSIEPGRPTDLGYTIRQHGVTPVALDGTALVVTLTDGRTLRFDGTPSGPAGHYVAQVTVPDAGRYALSVEQGWFGPQELGHLDVGEVVVAGGSAASSTPASGGGSDGWPWPVKALLVVATAGALLFLGAQVGARRRRPASA
jgi:hypothetical protein